jgi:hypothetical protein
VSAHEKTNRGWLNSFLCILWEESDKTYGTVEIVLAVIPLILNGVTNIEIIKPFLSTIGMVTLVSLINEGWLTWYVIVGAVGIIWPLTKRAMRSDSWYFPALKIVLGPDHINDTHEGAFRAKYVLARIERNNPGKSNNCRASLIQVEKHDGNGSFKGTNFNVPIQLDWTGDEPITREIQFGIPSYLAIFSVNDQYNRIVLRSHKNIRRYESLFDEQTIYKLLVRVTADESAPVDLSLIVDWRGRWDTFRAYEEVALTIEY